MVELRELNRIDIIMLIFIFIKNLNVLAHESLNLNSVAEKFHSSRPAISKHIKILTECGLIVIKQQGRERYCEAKLQKLNEISEWVEQYKIFWTKKLDALDDFLSKKTSSGKNKKAAKKSSIKKAPKRNSSSTKNKK